MKKIIKNFPLLSNFLISLRHRLWQTDTIKGLKAYLLIHKVTKIQLRAGSNNLSDWFNTDYFPRSNVFFLDVTKPFPIPSDSFKFIFSEHHIEHISYKYAVEMIKEAFRIMKPGGHIRISTPDLQKYVKTYMEDDTFMKAELELHAKNWIYGGFYNAINYVPIDDYFKAHFVNDVFLNYEHKFIYDYKSLKIIWKMQGFVM